MTAIEFKAYEVALARIAELEARIAELEAELRYAYAYADTGWLEAQAKFAVDAMQAARDQASARIAELEAALRGLLEGDLSATTIGIARAVLKKGREAGGTDASADPDLLGEEA